MILLFIFGSTIGFPHYVPPAVFVLRFGGDHAATLSCFLDVIALTISAIITLVGTHLSELNGTHALDSRSTWRYNFLVVSSCLFGGVIAYTLYFRAEIKVVVGEN